MTNRELIKSVRIALIEILLDVEKKTEKEKNEFVKIFILNKSYDLPKKVADTCVEHIEKGQRILAIQNLRSWWNANGDHMYQLSLRDAKDFIDRGFPYEYNGRLGINDLIDWNKI